MPKKSLNTENNISQENQGASEEEFNLTDLFDYCDMLLDASFFKGDKDKEIFMELRKIIDSAYAKRNKSAKEEKEYDDIIYNLTTKCIDDENLQDFMGYAYKKGKYDFCLLNYEKYLKWTILAASNGNGFSISKLELFFANQLNEVLTLDGIDKIAEVLELEDERFIILIIKKLCDNIVRIMQLNAVDMIKEPEVYLEQTEQLMRKYDKIKDEACSYLKEECQELINSINNLEKAEKEVYVNKPASEEKVEENKQLDVHEEALKQVDSKNKFTKKPTIKKFRWWYDSFRISHYYCN